MNRKFLPMCLAMLITGFANRAVCQQDTTNQPNVVVTYTKVNYNDPKERDHDIFTLIKVNPLIIFNGDMPIYVERRLTDQVSIEGAVGVTYMNYIYEAFALEPVQGTYIEERNAKLGYSAMGSLKFYPSMYTKALDEFYFGVEARYRVYKSEALDCGGTSLRLYVPESRNMLDLKITLGYVSYLSDRVIADFYGGFGMRKRDYSRAYCETTGGSNETAYQTVDDLVPTISAGVKIGFGF